MLYYLFDWLNKQFSPPGGELIRFLTFRSAMAALTALAISFFVGPKIIAQLKRMQIAEHGKQEAPKQHLAKAGTPMMGGLIILAATLAPALLWGDIGNIYVILVLIATIIMGGIGFLDDYLKIVKKKRKGLIARWKLVGQITVGLIIGGVVMLSSATFGDIATATTVPFFKNLVFDFGAALYIPFVILVITATSNAVNITDGLDGLAAGTTGIAFLAIMALAYFTGNLQISEYLNIPYLRGAGELTVFCAAIVGATLGFLWFNAYPAQVFMGDTGSLALGGAMGATMVLIKKEFVLPIIGGLFFIESLSVIMQTLYFKYTRKRYGEGRRIFKMAPIHHHFELLGWMEPKIVTRAYIIAILLAILTLTTFKVR